MGSEVRILSFMCLEMKRLSIRSLTRLKQEYLQNRAEIRSGINAQLEA